MPRAQRFVPRAGGRPWDQSQGPDPLSRALPQSSSPVLWGKCGKQLWGATSASGASHQGHPTVCAQRGFTRLPLSLELGYKEGRGRAGWRGACALPPAVDSPQRACAACFPRVSTSVPCPRSVLPGSVSRWESQVHFTEQGTLGRFTQGLAEGHQLGRGSGGSLALPEPFPPPQAGWAEAGAGYSQPCSGKQT